MAVAKPASFADKIGCRFQGDPLSNLIAEGLFYVKKLK